MPDGRYANGRHDTQLPNETETPGLHTVTGGTTSTVPTPLAQLTAALTTVAATPPRRHYRSLPLGLPGPQYTERRNILQADTHVGLPTTIYYLSRHIHSADDTSSRHASPDGKFRVAMRDHRPATEAPFR